MFRIVESAFLAPDIKRFVIEAPRIARKRQAGQFVIVRVHPRGERIPLTIADGDPARGTISWACRASTSTRSTRPTNS